MLFCSTAKIEEGRSANFPILQGLKRQEQLAQDQQTQARQKQAQQQQQQQQRQQQGRNATVAVAPGTQAVHKNAVWQDESDTHSARFPTTNTLIADDGFMSTGYDQNLTVKPESPQFDTSHPFYPTRSYLSNIHDQSQLDDDGLYSAVGASQQFPGPQYYADRAFEQENLASQGDRFDGHSGRPRLAYGFPPAGEQHHAVHDTLPSRNTRLSLPPTRFPQTTAQSSQSRDLYSRMHRQQSADAGRNWSAPKFPIPQATASRGAKQFPYFAGRGGLDTRNHAPDSSRTVNFETSQSQESTSAELEWSTFPVRKASHGIRAPDVKTKAFRLPRKLFGSPDRAFKAETAETTQRSADSATEVVLPLRRSKLTLFQPSPPKLGGSDL